MQLLTGSPISAPDGWSSQSLMNIPAQLSKSIHKNPVRDAEFCGGVSHVDSPPLKLQPPTFAAVLDLLGLRNPAAVFLAVWAVCINAIKRIILAGTFAHISKKSCKCSPLVTDRNTSAAVVFERPKSLAGAAFNHAAPSVVSQGRLTFGAVPVLCVLCHFFTLKWPTVNDAWQTAVRQLFGSYPSQASRFYQEAA